MIYEVGVTVNKMAAGKFARWLPEHVKRVLEAPGFKQARVCRWENNDSGTNDLHWTVQYEVDSKKSLQMYFQERAPALQAETVHEFGDAVSATRKVYDRVQLITRPAPESGLPMTDFPKLRCPFIRQTFKVDINQWKKWGRQYQLRSPEVYLAVNRINPGYEWVFEDANTFAVEKLHGTNVKVLMEGGRVVAIQNRKNLIDPLQVAKGQNFILEGLLHAAGRDQLPVEGEHAGEVIGPKFQGNPYKLEVHEWYPFEKAITDLRFRSFEEHARTYENWSSWFKDFLHSRLFTKRAKKKGLDEKVFAEGVVFYNLQRRAEGKTWMAKLRRDMFPWYYSQLEIPDFNPAGRDKVEDQEQFD